MPDDREIPPTIDFLADQFPIEAMTLAQAAARGELALECLNCRRLTAFDMQELLCKYGGGSIIGTMLTRARCRRCRRLGADALLHLKGRRKDAAWYPRPPRRGR